MEQVKQQQAELDRQLMQAEQSQKDAVEIADALILKAMEFSPSILASITLD